MFKFLREGRQCTKAESIKTSDGSDLSEFATSFVLNYFQSWGQGLEKRLEMLSDACKKANIKAEFIQKNGECGWRGEDIKELEKAHSFRKELDDSFPVGSIEAEICAVTNIIKRYKARR